VPRTRPGLRGKASELAVKHADKIGKAALSAVDQIAIDIAPPFVANMDEAMDAAKAIHAEAVNKGVL